MQDLQNAIQTILTSLPSLIGAILILIIGFWVANAVAKKIGNLLSKNQKLKDSLHKISGGDKNDDAIIGMVIKVIFYIIVLFVLGAVLDILGLKSMTEPINKFLGPIFAFIPNLIAALVVGVVGFVVAMVVKMVVQNVSKTAKLDEKFQKEANGTNVNISKALADIAFWVVLLFFLPLILSSLKLNNVLQPLQNMIDKVLGLLPNIIVASLVLFVGLFIAKKFKDVTASILSSLGLDNLLKSEKEDQMKLSSIAGMTVYILVVIPVISASLSILGLQALSAPITNMIDSILAYVPVIFSASVIVFIAYIIGKILGEIVTGIVGKFNLEKGLKSMGVLSEANNMNIGKISGKVLHVLIVFFAVLQATELLGFNQLTIISQQLIVLAGQIALGLVIIGVGFYLANIVANLIKKQQTKSSETMALVSRVVIIFFAISMGLHQMGVAEQIVNMAFGFIVGAIALAAAIAFGIGGKEEASKFLKDMRENKDK